MVDGELQLHRAQFIGNVLDESGLGSFGCIWPESRNRALILKERQVNARARSRQEVSMES